MSGLRVVALGRPVPQGSKRHVGRGILVESSNVAPWRQTIEVAAASAVALEGWERTALPVSVELTYYFDRPKSHYRTGQHSHLVRDGAPYWPATRAQGDIEKLVRATHDAFTSAGVWQDDSQVAHVMAGKRWTSTSPSALATPGMTAVVRLLHEVTP